MDTKATVVLGDAQAPYHDEDAVEVALQVCEDIRPFRCVLNGDWPDFRTLGRWPNIPQAQTCDDFAEELERTRTLLKKVKRRLKTVKDWRYNAGNHDWRIERLFMRDAQLVRLLGEKKIADATSVRTLLELDKLGIKYTGQYPQGTWLLDPRFVAPERNCYVEHGYQSRKNAGYTASALLTDRMTNVVTGHVERLAVIWKKVLGNRRFFAAEGGNLSRIAEPGKGEHVYSGVPFSQPEFLNHQQGIMVIYHDGKEFYPFAIPIHNGVAVWNGRRYKA